MSVLLHKTGINRSGGAKTNQVTTSNLLTVFTPSSTYVSAPLWTSSNSISRSLRMINGVTFNSTPSPSNFSFDGTDDHLGATSASYGGTVLSVAFANAYTLGQWVFLPSTWSSGKEHFLFELKDSDSNHVMFEINGSDLRLRSRTSSGNSDPSSFAPNYNFVLGKNKWIYVTVTHNGSGLYTMYLNGKFVGTANGYYAPSGSSADLKVGIYNPASASARYTDAGVKVGHIHVHTAQLTGSQIRQNCLASHDVHNSRLYGDITLYTE